MVATSSSRACLAKLKKFTFKVTTYLKNKSVSYHSNHILNQVSASKNVIFTPKLRVKIVGMKLDNFLRFHLEQNQSATGNDYEVYWYSWSKYNAYMQLPPPCSRSLLFLLALLQNGRHVVDGFLGWLALACQPLQSLCSCIFFCFFLTTASPACKI